MSNEINVLDKRERFLKVAESRTNKVVKYIQLLGNCSNGSHYEYTKAEVEEMFKSIESELKVARERFEVEILKGNRSNFKFSRK